TAHRTPSSSGYRPPPCGLRPSLALLLLRLNGLAGLRPGHLGLPDVPRDRSLRRLKRRLQRLEPVVDVADRGGLELARQSHDLALQLADRDLPLAVPDLELEDRHLVGHPGDALLLRRQQAGQPVGRALADQDNA